MSAATDKLHHLTKDAKTGRWEMRLTVEEGRVFKGKPIRVKFGKCSEEQAIRLRDQHLRSLEQAGVVLKLRKQRRKS